MLDVNFQVKGEDIDVNNKTRDTLSFISLCQSSLFILPLSQVLSFSPASDTNLAGKEEKNYKYSHTAGRNEQKGQKNIDISQKEEVTGEKNIYIFICIFLTGDSETKERRKIAKSFYLYISLCVHWLSLYEETRRGDSEP